MSTVLSSESSTVGIVGRGFISVLVAKLAALAGYDTWMICPTGQEATILSLLNEECRTPSNLELIPSSDTESVQGRMADSSALLVAVDDDTTMDESVINYLLDPETAKNMKRVVCMSRNLNNQGMGFLVKASKMSANNEVWDGSNADVYKNFEIAVKRQALACGAEYTIVRAGTLKGGACGEDEFQQYLTKKYYEMTKKDIVTWQLLFDCNVRGVKIAKGDVLPGPGGRAIFTATGTDALPGDTGRCGLAEAMVRSLEVEAAGNVDFGVGTDEGREPPSTQKWEELFNIL
eukprot:CAMPEP_0184870426 /NCGR_PEP_ID=MMETSP0580-20130426/37403_1 /TAXON_ID=1118495 /ORGANISM="Dactyliosolen fragilissimus" /LENGTH=289 /DNA_ID=CAMNT_0027372475 /DNA_START=89 /DNA_END=958 /DNA_ORIENTATION=+